MALKFFTIALNQIAISTHADKQREMDDKFMSTVAHEFKELDGMLNEGWTVVASDKYGSRLGVFTWEFLLYKADG